MIRVLISVGVFRGSLFVNVGVMVSLKQILGKRKVIYYERYIINIVDCIFKFYYVYLWLY